MPFCGCWLVVNRGLHFFLVFWVATNLFWEGWPVVPSIYRVLLLLGRLKTTLASWSGLGRKNWVEASERGCRCFATFCFANVLFCMFAKRWWHLFWACTGFFEKMGLYIRRGKAKDRCWLKFGGHRRQIKALSFWNYKIYEHTLCSSVAFWHRWTYAIHRKGFPQEHPLTKLQMKGSKLKILVELLLFIWLLFLLFFARRNVPHQSKYAIHSKFFSREPSKILQNK